MMTFKIGQRVKVVEYPDADVPVVGRIGTVTGVGAYYSVALNNNNGLEEHVFDGYMLLAPNELEYAGCCGNQHELCDECPLAGGCCPCVGDPPCEDCPAMGDPRNGDTGIFGRADKPRTGSEAVLLRDEDIITDIHDQAAAYDAALLAYRESTAPNADRIARLERNLEDEEGCRQIQDTRIAALEDKVQELTDALADAREQRARDAADRTLWLDTYER